MIAFAAFTRRTSTAEWAENPGVPFNAVIHGIVGMTIRACCALKIRISASSAAVYRWFHAVDPGRSTTLEPGGLISKRSQVPIIAMTTVGRKFRTDVANGLRHSQFSANKGGTGIVPVSSRQPGLQTSPTW